MGCNTTPSTVISPALVTSTTRPTGRDLYAGMRIYELDTSRELLYDGTGWICMSEPSVTSWVPVWTQGAVISKTVTVARYVRSNGWCSGYFRLDATSTGTAANVIAGSLPISSTGNQGIFGTWQFYNPGVGFKSGPMYVGGASTWSTAEDALTTSGITTPTTAIGDIFWAHFHYEMATRYL